MVRPFIMEKADMRSLPLPPALGTADSSIRVVVPLPSRYRSTEGAFDRLEAALTKIPGVIASRIETHRMELQLELACGSVTPYQLVRALHVGFESEFWRGDATTVAGAGRH